MREEGQEYYGQVETGIEVSSEESENIDELMRLSEKCVTCPIQVLYDYDTKALRRESHMAFQRIYRLINTAADNRLSLPELSLYNQKAFDQVITQAEFQGILTLIQEHTQEPPQPFITQEGFLALQKIMIERSKAFITWQFLRTFHYDSRLNNSLIDDPDAALYMSQYQPIEVTKRTYMLLTQMFTRIAPSRRMTLPMLSQVFYDSKYIPWHNIPHMVRLEGDCITLDLWIMLWNYLAFVDPLQCYRSMTFIGIDVSFESAFKFHSNGMGRSSLLNKKNRHIL